MANFKNSPRENLYTAILVCTPPNAKPVFFKYRRVAYDNAATKKRFLDYCMKFEHAHHVNFYTGITKKFYVQEKLTQ